MIDTSDRDRCDHCGMPLPLSGGYAVVHRDGRDVRVHAYTADCLAALKARIEILEAENGLMRERVAALGAQRDEDIRWAAGREQRVAEFVDGLLRILDLGQDDDEYEIDFDVITAAAAAMATENAGLREKPATAVRYEIDWKIRHGDDTPGPCEEPGCDERWAVIVTGSDGVDRRLCAGHAGHTETAEYLVVGFE